MEQQAATNLDEGMAEYLTIAQRTAVMGGGERMEALWRRNQAIWAAAIRRGSFLEREMMELRTMRMVLEG